MRVGLYAQHTAEEFDLRLTNAEGATIGQEVERTWVAQHEHDDEVGSIAIEREGDVDPERLNEWLGELLRERGVDIFRMKGFISLAGESRRFVFQGVHMLFDGQPDRPWGDAPRRNQLVFIGRNLDEQSMRQRIRGMSDLNVDSPRGVLRRGWSAEVADYAIAGGWSLRGEALMVGDAAGGVYAFDGKSGATAWARRGVHEGGVLAAADPPGRNRVRNGRPGRASLDLECRRRSGKPGYRRSEAVGLKTLRGRRTANGWQPPAPGRFARTVWMEWKSGDLMIIPARSARSPGRAQGSWRRPVTVE